MTAIRKAAWTERDSLEQRAATETDFSAVITQSQAQRLLSFLRKKSRSPEGL